MLGKFYINVRFKEAGRIRGRGGEAVMGFLLNEVSQVSKDYAQTLHDAKGNKPYAISPLLPISNGVSFQVSDGVMTIDEGNSAKILISALDETTLGVVMRAMIDAHKEKREINIGGVRAEITKIGIKESEGAKYTTFSDIIKRDKIKNTVRFRFLTPLSFRKNGIQQTFPLPELVFSSLLKTWNAFSEIKFPEGIRKKFSCIAVARYNLHTELWHFSRYKIFGSRGGISYDFSKGFSEEEIKILNSLSELANFSGVGYKRTMGMGMVNVRFG